MLTISCALKGVKEPPPKKTLADLKVGEAFKWVRSRDSGGVCCVKVGTIDGEPLSSSPSIRKVASATYWMPIEGSNAGFIFTDYDASVEVYQP